MPSLEWFTLFTLGSPPLSKRHWQAGGGGDFWDSIQSFRFFLSRQFPARALFGLLEFRGICDASHASLAFSKSMSRTLVGLEPFGQNEAFGAPSLFAGLGMLVDFAEMLKLQARFYPRQKERGTQKKGDVVPDVAVAHPDREKKNMRGVGPRVPLTSSPDACSTDPKSPERSLHSTLISGTLQPPDGTPATISPFGCVVSFGGPSKTAGFWVVSL